MYNCEVSCCQSILYTKKIMIIISVDGKDVKKELAIHRGTVLGKVLTLSGFCKNKKYPNTCMIFDFGVKNGRYFYQI